MMDYPYKGEIFPTKHYTAIHKPEPQSIPRVYS